MVLTWPLGCRKYLTKSRYIKYHVNRHTHTHSRARNDYGLDYRAFGLLQQLFYVRACTAGEKKSVILVDRVCVLIILAWFVAAGFLSLYCLQRCWIKLRIDLVQCIHVKIFFVVFSKSESFTLQWFGSVCLFRFRFILIEPEFFFSHISFPFFPFTFKQIYLFISTCWRV